MTPYAYIRLCGSAPIETLRRHPMLTSYINTFMLHAKRNGVTNARAWLLGRVLIDLHPQTDTPIHPPLQQDTQPPPTFRQTPNTPRGRLQEHIEAAASHVAQSIAPPIR